MTDTERIGIWWNPQAGHGRARELADRARLEATARGHSATLLPSSSATVSRTAADEAVADGIDRLIVVGGDGTVHQAVQVAAGTPLVVGIVPAGSGNDVIDPLGLAHDPAVAIDRALGPGVPVDLLRIGDRYGVTVATLGFSVSVNQRADRLRWPRGRAKYTAATIRELIGLRPYPLIVVLDGRRLEVAPNLLAFANTSDFGGGMRIAPDARPDDGQLELVVVGPAARATLLRVLPRVRTGRHIEHAAVQVHRGARATIETDQSWEVRADGEVVGSTPVDIEIVPAALQLAGRLVCA
ncbi:MAG: diacylglycerol kinase family protein [Actinomycetota bacterium]